MRLKLIATGGTIACVPSPGGLLPGMGAEQLLDYVCEEADAACVDLFSMDSSNIQPEEWLLMAQEIHASVQAGDCGGVVITHGTDTMAYTASMLTFLLQGLPIPAVLTGAQYPILRRDSDGRKNLNNAFIAARSLPGGVYVCFGDAVIRGCRAVKTRTTSLNAFESINAPYVGAVANGRYIPLLQPEPRGEYRRYDAIDPRVALIKLIPGTSPAFIESVLGCDIRGVVVEAFGLGGVHNFRRDHAESIRRLIDAGVPVVLTSQCLYESSTVELYEVSRALREAGVISAGDMTTEAAVTKLMWALGQAQQLEAVRRIMRTDLCGEISGASLRDTAMI